MNMVKGLKGIKAKTKKKVYVQFNVELENDLEGGGIFYKGNKE